MMVVTCGYDALFSCPNLLHHSSHFKMAAKYLSVWARTSKQYCSEKGVATSSLSFPVVTWRIWADVFHVGYDSSGLKALNSCKWWGKIVKIASRSKRRCRRGTVGWCTNMDMSRGTVVFVMVGPRCDEGDSHGREGSCALAWQQQESSGHSILCRMMNHSDEEVQLLVQAFGGRMVKSPSISMWELPRSGTSNSDLAKIK